MPDRDLDGLGPRLQDVNPGLAIAALAILIKFYQIEYPLALGPRPGGEEDTQREATANRPQDDPPVEEMAHQPPQPEPPCLGRAGEQELLLPGEKTGKR